MPNRLANQLPRTAPMIPAMMFVTVVRYLYSAELQVIVMAIIGRPFPMTALNRWTGVPGCLRNVTDAESGFLLGKKHLLMDRGTKFSEAFRVTYSRRKAPRISRNGMERYYYREAA